ncbi:MAG: ABC transporter permease [Hyphomonas sp.]|uniref:ABC transporter permease n=1 Tax=Hyphomonas sp. TaxID=87 RepID=UPI00349FDA98
MFAFTVARRYLFSSPAQTALLISGVTLGVMAFVFITALIGGLAIRLTNDVTANSAHISLEPATRIARVLPGPDGDVGSVAIISTFQRRQIRAWNSTVSLLRSDPAVSAISPQISGSAFLVKGEAVSPVAVTALDPAYIDAISSISSKIISGDGSLGADGILIGSRLAENLGLSSGQPVLLRTDRGIDRLLTVRGIFQTGLQSLDERVAYLSIQTARPLFLLPEGITNIEIKLHDPGRAREIATFLHEATGLRATSWQEKNASLEGALEAQSQTGTLIQAFSMISVLVGIASALSLSANRRRGEIGIMRAFGVSSSFIAGVFVLQGLLIGMAGAGIGCVSGFALCAWLETLTRPDGTMVLPIAPREGGYLAVFVLTTIGAVLASVIPAGTAARLDPLEAIQQ